MDQHHDTAQAAECAAGRFDEIVAVVAGLEVPDTLATQDILPLERRNHVEAAGEEAEREALDDLPQEVGHEFADDDYDAVFAARHAAYEAAQQEWDAWFDDACARVDALEKGSQDTVNCINFDAIPGFGAGSGLTSPALLANGRDRSPAPASDHPSETAGAGPDSSAPA